MGKKVLIACAASAFVVLLAVGASSQGVKESIQASPTSSMYGARAYVLDTIPIDSVSSLR